MGNPRHDGPSWKQRQNPRVRDSTQDSPPSPRAAPQTRPLTRPRAHLAPPIGTFRTRMCAAAALPRGRAGAGLRHSAGRGRGGGGATALRGAGPGPGAWLRPTRGAGRGRGGAGRGRGPPSAERGTLFSSETPHTLSGAARFSSGPPARPSNSGLGKSARCLSCALAGFSGREEGQASRCSGTCL